MNKIKVLWIFAGGLRRNGICVSQLDYYKNINKKDFQIDVAAVHNNSQEMINKYLEAGCMVYVLPDRRKNLFKYLKELKKLMQKEKYDIVHVHGSSSLMLLELNIAKKCNVGVRIAHSRNTTCDRPYLEKIIRRLFNKSYTHAFACGKDAGEWLFDNKRFTILHVGKDIDKYKFNIPIRNKKRKELELKKDNIAIGHVGIFNNQKNHAFLINVFHEIYNSNKKTTLFLFGQGALQDEIKKLVENLHLEKNVHFMNNVNDIENYLQAMDVMLLPSLFEGLPNVVLEWQASGLKSFISDNITKECKVTDLVEFISIDDLEKWVDEINSFQIPCDSDRKKISEKTCDALMRKGFEIKTNAKKLENYYKEFLKEDIK